MGEEEEEEEEEKEEEEEEKEEGSKMEDAERGWQRENDTNYNDPNRINYGEICHTIHSIQSVPVMTEVIIRFHLYHAK